MTSINLTREEAVQRSRMIEVDHYDVTLDLKYSDTHFLSTTKVSFTSREIGSTFIDLRAEEIQEVRLNGNPLPTESYNPTYGIPRCSRWRAPQHAQERPYSGEGLYYCIHDRRYA